mmetsp:Transcript_1215/g.3387  ORF Transcript_1215/g.3387 Transcript_1215/m.3387 type:complete len:242 (-) Transcript_1215:447-1172(-)
MMSSSSSTTARSAWLRPPSTASNSQTLPRSPPQWSTPCPTRCRPRARARRPATSSDGSPPVLHSPSSVRLCAATTRASRSRCARLRRRVWAIPSGWRRASVWACPFRRSTRWALPSSRRGLKSQGLTMKPPCWASATVRRGFMIMAPRPLSPSLWMDRNMSCRCDEHARAQVPRHAGRKLLGAVRRGLCSLSWCQSRVERAAAQACQFWENACGCATAPLASSAFRAHPQRGRWLCCHQTL